MTWRTLALRAEHAAAFAGSYEPVDLGPGSVRSSAAASPRRGGRRSGRRRAAPAGWRDVLGVAGARARDCATRSRGARRPSARRDPRPDRSMARRRGGGDARHRARDVLAEPLQRLSQPGLHAEQLLDLPLQLADLAQTFRLECRRPLLGFEASLAGRGSVDSRSIWSRRARISSSEPRASSRAHACRRSGCAAPGSRPASRSRAESCSRARTRAGRSAGRSAPWRHRLRTACSRGRTGRSSLCSLAQATACDRCRSTPRTGRLTHRPGAGRAMSRGQSPGHGPRRQAVAGAPETAS